MENTEDILMTKFYQERLLTVTKNREYYTIKVLAKTVPWVFKSFSSYYGSPLFSAVHAKDLTAISLLQHGGMDINLTSKDGFCALKAAFIYDDINTVRYLIHHGGDVNNNKGRYTLLSEAIWQEQYSFVRLLIEYGANVNLQSETGESALMTASNKGDFRMTSFLLEIGADVSLQDNEGNNALFYALELVGNKSVTQILIDAGADVNHQNHNGLTPLMISSIYRTNPENVDVLIENDADIAMKDKNGDTALTLSLTLGYKYCWQLFYNAHKQTEENFIESGESNVENFIYHFPATNHACGYTYQDTRHHHEISEMYKKYGIVVSSENQSDVSEERKSIKIENAISITRKLAQNGANIFAINNDNKTVTDLAKDYCQSSYNASETHHFFCNKLPELIGILENPNAEIEANKPF